MVVLAVQGGSLSEGIDLPGEALIGCVVVGPPLPPFDLERQLIKDYFDRSLRLRRAYAYTYPAMAKAIQAAGRVIRSAEDRGLLVFLDRPLPGARLRPVLPPGLVPRVPPGGRLRSNPGGCEPVLERGVTRVDPPEKYLLEARLPEGYYFLNSLTHRS